MEEYEIVLLAALLGFILLRVAQQAKVRRTRAAFA